MAFTSPFFQGTQAQSIIDNYRVAGGYNQSFPSPSTNPYRVNSSAFVPPSSQPEPDPDIPDCNEAYPGEGRVYDPVMNACVLPEVSTLPEGNGREETQNNSDRMYNEMARDVTDPYGAGNEIDKYFESEDAYGKYYNFDPSVGEPPPIFGLGLLDKLFGGPERREDRFRTAVETINNQTSFKNRPPYYVDTIWPYLNNPLGTNPFMFGQVLNSNGVLKKGYSKKEYDDLGEIYQMFSPEKYLDRVGSTNVLGNNQSTVNDLLRSMENAESNRSNQQGTPIAVDMTGSTLTGNSLRNDDGSRNDTNYKATVAKNIGRNIGSSNTSKFSEKLGGFYGGR